MSPSITEGTEPVAGCSLACLKKTFFRNPKLLKPELEDITSFMNMIRAECRW